MTVKYFPELIRVSIGSAILLGLLRGKLDAKPTTIYLLLCRNEKCSANCSFCPQAKDSKGRADMLSRVIWPVFPIEKIIDAIEKTVKLTEIKRLCIQSLNYPEAFDDVSHLVKKVNSRVNVPISVSFKPINEKKMKKWSKIGVNRISIALDAATEEIFDKTKGQRIGGPFFWNKQLEALQDAIEVFGEGSVSTHIIVGLGETEKELCRIIQKCVSLGVTPGLFAFTPISGTILENKSPPPLNTYRRIQVANYLLVKKIALFKKMRFDENGCLVYFGISKKKILKIINSGKPFQTSGCPGCNRPYYNERPSGPFYNYPRQLNPEEIEEIKKDLKF
jgi:biotin synthase-related radical SAM superfamily protein